MLASRALRQTESGDLMLELYVGPVDGDRKRLITYDDLIRTHTPTDVAGFAEAMSKPRIRRNVAVKVSAFSQDMHAIRAGQASKVDRSRPKGH